MRAILILIIAVCGFRAGAQEIAGRMLDDKKDPVVSGVVYVMQGGKMRGGSTTDYDGNYIIKPLDPGYYDVIAIYTGYDTIKTTDVIVAAGQRTTVHVNMAPTKTLHNVIIRKYKKPLVGTQPTGQVVHPPAPDNIQISEINDLLLACHGAPSGTPVGEALNISGGRVSGIVYIIDGVVVQPVSAKVASLVSNPGDHIFTRADLNHMPYTDLRNIAATVPGVYQARLGDELHVFGSR